MSHTVQRLTTGWRILRGKFHETKKYWDPRRRAIYSQVALTKEQKKAIDQLYLTHYGRKIPYTWHRHYTAFTGNFDEKYIPESLYLPEFELHMNCAQYYAKAFSDKNLQPMISAAAGIAMPRTILSCVEGVLRDTDNQFLSAIEAEEILRDQADAFCKPSVDSNSGRGCFAVSFVEGVDRLSGKTAGQILAELGNNFVIQQRLFCHEDIRRLYAGAVNTFRVTTYRWRDQICYIPAVMRIGQKGAVVDNAHAGGMVIAIDDDGTLHEKAFTEFRQEYTCHPDTGVSFAGYRIGNFPAVLDAAVRAHQAIPQLGVVSWDFTLDEEGIPVLIESNLKSGSVWLFQMSHGCGPFGERTAEILEWLKLMRKTKHPEEHRFGRM